MIRLSIILPIYNVEQYLSNCLTSCVNQGLSEGEYEIIAVNDGSPDGSAAIVKTFQLDYPNIKLINRENGGLSAARNTGLKEARGKYVWFIDSDDWIEYNCTPPLLEFAETNNLDVLCFGAKIYRSPRQTKETASPQKEQYGQIFDGESFISKVQTIPSAWSALYRRDFLMQNQLKFYEGILHEDQEFTPRAYCLAKRIAYLHKPIYYYYQRSDSIMKSKQDKRRCRDLISVADSLYDFAQTNLKPGSAAYNSIIYKVNFCVGQSLAYYTPEAMPLGDYRKKPYYPLVTTGLHGFVKWKLKLANFSLPLYLAVHKLVTK